MANKKSRTSHIEMCALQGRTCLETADQPLRYGPVAAARLRPFKKTRLQLEINDFGMNIKCHLTSNHTEGSLSSACLCRVGHSSEKPAQKGVSLTKLLANYYSTRRHLVEYPSREGCLYNAVQLSIQ